MNSPKESMGYEVKERELNLLNSKWIIRSYQPKHSLFSLKSDANLILILSLLSGVTVFILVVAASLIHKKNFDNLKDLSAQSTLLQEELKIILNNIKEGIICCDPNGQIHFTNKALNHRANNQIFNNISEVFIKNNLQEIAKELSQNGSKVYPNMDLFKYLEQNPHNHLNWETNLSSKSIKIVIKKYQQNYIFFLEWQE